MPSSRSASHVAVALSAVAYKLEQGTGVAKALYSSMLLRILAQQAPASKQHQGNERISKQGTGAYYVVYIKA